MKKQKDDWEKSWKDKKITVLSQHMKSTGHSPARKHKRTIYRENNFKKRKFKAVARVKSHDNKQLMNKKDKIQAIFNLRKIFLNNKT